MQKKVERGERMEPKLILVEGLPGSGVTTITNKMKKELEEEGNQVVVYRETSTHPTDMTRQAYITKEEYHEFVADCLTEWIDSKQTISDEELIRRIEMQCQWEDDSVFIAYRNIDFPEGSYEKIMDKLEKKRIFGGKCSFETFKMLHLRRWERFAKAMQVRKEVAIFESAYLKNQLLELFCYHEKGEEEILDYMMELIHTVDFLNPHMIYVMTDDVEASLRKAVRGRKKKRRYKDWYDVLEEAVQDSRYAKERHLSGVSGMVQLLKEKQRLDYMVLERIGILVSWVSN